MDKLFDSRDKDNFNDRNHNYQRLIDLEDEFSESNQSVNEQNKEDLLSEVISRSSSRLVMPFSILLQMPITRIIMVSLQEYLEERKDLKLNLTRMMAFLLLLLDIIILNYISDRGVKIVLLIAANVYLFIFIFYLYETSSSSKKLKQCYDTEENLLKN